MLYYVYMMANSLPESGPPLVASSLYNLKHSSTTTAATAAYLCNLLLPTYYIGTASTFHYYRLIYYRRLGLPLMHCCRTFLVADRRRSDLPP